MRPSPALQIAMDREEAARHAFVAVQERLVAQQGRLGDGFTTDVFMADPAYRTAWQAYAEAADSLRVMQANEQPLEVE